MIKRLNLLIILLFVLSAASNAQQKSTAKKTLFNVTATYTAYHTALGKGRGIIFRVTVPNNTKNPFTIDSFYVKNKPLKFQVKQNSKGLTLESNYLVNTPEPSLNKDGSIIKTKEPDDEIILKRKFYPSWIILDQRGNKIKINIENYKEAKQKINY